MFAHAFALSFGKAVGGTLAERAAQIAGAATHVGATRLHVWQSESVEDAEQHAREFAAADPKALVAPLSPVEDALRVIRKAYPQFVLAQPSAGDVVLDVVLVPGASSSDKTEWWYGQHAHSAAHRPWAGGKFPVIMPPAAPSRAYLKLEEGLEWSGLPLHEGDVALELGSAPGGASYALLERGLRVIGVDPGDMGREILKNPRFRHLRRQALQLRKEDVEGVQWIFSDMNVPPAEVLRAVEKKSVWLQGRLLGGLLTLKLANWNLAAEIPELLKQLQKMGFTRVAATHLYYNRREICVACLTSQGERFLAGSKHGIFSKAR